MPEASTAIPCRRAFAAESCSVRSQPSGTRGIPSLVGSIRAGLAFLQIRLRERRRKHMCLHRGPVPQALRRHERWSVDFVHVSYSMAGHFGVLTVVDQFSRQTPLLEPRFSFSGRDVVAALHPQTCSGGLRFGQHVDDAVEQTFRHPTSRLALTTARLTRDHDLLRSVQADSFPALGTLLAVRHRQQRTAPKTGIDHRLGRHSQSLAPFVKHSAKRRTGGD